MAPSSRVKKILLMVVRARLVALNFGCTPKFQRPDWKESMSDLLVGINGVVNGRVASSGKLSNGR